METNLTFNRYMDQYYEYPGLWDSPSKCGLRVIRRKDGKVLVIATELYRQNPGTSVTDWCPKLATRIMKELHASPDNFIFIEHSPDMGSKLTFYGETFDLVSFEWDGNDFDCPNWHRVTIDQVDAMLNE